MTAAASHASGMSLAANFFSRQSSRKMAHSAALYQPVQGGKMRFVSYRSSRQPIGVVGFRQRSLSTQTLAREYYLQRCHMSGEQRSIQYLLYATVSRFESRRTWGKLCANCKLTAKGATSGSMPSASTRITLLSAISKLH